MGGYVFERAASTPNIFRHVGATMQMPSLLDSHHLLDHSSSLSLQAITMSGHFFT